MSNEQNDSFSFNLDPYHSFLEPLIGEEVQVFRGGPESKTGRIVDVQSDYVALLVQDDNDENDSNNNNNSNSKSQNNKNSKNNKNNNKNDDDEQDYTVIYYRTEHLQTIGENTISNSMPRFSEEEVAEVTFKTGTDFLNLVEQFTGEYVQINQGGPESKKGTLLEVSGNYMALLTEDDGVVFYNIHHVKSICESKNNSNEDSDGEQTIPEYYKASSFNDLFSKMNYKWVSINRGGPEAIEGVLIVTGGGGHYTLINNDEVLRVNPYHIKSISCGPKGAMKSSSNSSDDQNSDEYSNGNESSSSKRSSSKRSSSKRSSSKRSSSKRSSSKRSSSKRSSSKRSSSRRSSSRRRSSKRSSSRRSSSRRSSSKRRSSRKTSES